jgi:chlorite dismutase
MAKNGGNSMYGLILVLLVVCTNVNVPGVARADDTHIFSTFALFTLDDEWGRLSSSERRKGAQDATALRDDFQDRVTVDAYWTYGLTKDSHFLLRLHAADLHLNQRFLTEFQRTALGRHVHLIYTVTGVTKGLNYAPDFPDLLEQLKSAQYEGEPPRYAVMIPIRKSAAWWNLPKEERVVMMREHTVPTQRWSYLCGQVGGMVKLCFSSPNRTCTFQRIRLSIQAWPMAMATSR